MEVMHCKAHQKGMSPISQGNRRADQESKKTALGTDKQIALFPSVNGSNIKPKYRSEEISWSLEQGGAHEGFCVYIGQMLFLPVEILKGFA